MKVIRMLSCLALLLPMTPFAVAASSSSLGIGDRPPPLQAMAWIMGEPLVELPEGKVHVVNFFATWCGASQQSMRQMSSLAEQYAQDLSIIGVNVREAEHGEASVEAVSRFLAERWPKLPHSVAMDDPDSAPLFESWMRAAGMYGTPTAFIIGRDGRIAFIGIPIDQSVAYTFEQALADAIAGTSNMEAARAVHADTEREIAEYLDVRSIMEPVDAAREAGDHAAVVKAIEAIVAEHPDYRLRTLHSRLSALLRLDEAAAFEFVERELAYIDSSVELRGHRAGIRGSVGATIASVPELSAAAYARALKYLRQSLEEVPEGYAALLNWMSVARLEHASGHLDEAIAAQERVVVLARTTPEVPPDALPQLEQTLSDYREQRAARAIEP